jgi:predicted RNA-binding Zn ribbon-like protein
MSDSQPSDRPPAPGELGLVQAFVNTIDIEEGREELSSSEALRGWLAAHGLLHDGVPLTLPDLRTAIEVREALRALALANSGAAVDAAAVETLNRIASRAPLSVRFGPDGVARFEPADGGLAGALARLLGHVRTATVDGTWRRLKACSNDECRWVFYDYSKNRSGAWCTMAACGDKLKARAYRRRRRAGP